MNIEAFIAERRPVWQHLDNVLQRAEMAGDTLSRTDLHELVELYRRTASEAGHRAADLEANRRIIHWLVAVRAVIVHDVSEPCERLLQMFLQHEARMIGADGDAHMVDCTVRSAFSLGRRRASRR